MNVDSHKLNNIAGDYEFFLPHMRVVASSSIICPDGGGWQIVARVEGEASAIVGPGADCLLLAAEDLTHIAIDMVARAGLPLVLAVAADGVPPPAWIDLADGFVLPTDDDAMAAAVLQHVIMPVSSYTVAELTDGTARTINALSAEAGRIADQLARLAAEQRAGPDPIAVDARLVRRIIKLRRDRERYFPAEIFADPAWDMLLDLTAARLEGKRVPVSSLCIAAAVPTTTALRWIRSLTEAGLLDRYTDPSDARRSHIEIAETAATAMLTYLRAFNAAFTLR